MTGELLLYAYELTTQSNKRNLILCQETKFTDDDFQ